MELNVTLAEPLTSVFCNIQLCNMILLYSTFSFSVPEIKVLNGKGLSNHLMDELNNALADKAKELTGEVFTFFVAFFKVMVCKVNRCDTYDTISTILHISL